MANVIVYTSGHCPYCVKAKALLTSKGVDFKEIRVDLDDAMRDEMMEKSKRQTVPQIFINDQSIGGCDDLHELNKLGKLDALLSGV